MPLGLHMHSCCGDENCFVEQLVKADSSLSLELLVITLEDSYLFC
jgi:hypothetical protein